MPSEFEYLGKFKFIFKKFVDYETGSQMGLDDEKNRGPESHASVPLRACVTNSNQLEAN